MDKQHIRYYIKNRSVLGLNATQIHEELIAAYGDDYMSYPTIVRWLRAFFAGRKSLEDNPGSGRPITAATQDNIDAVKDLVDEDPHISIDYPVVVCIPSCNNIYACEKYRQDGYPMSSLKSNANDV